MPRRGSQQRAGRAALWALGAVAAVSAVGIATLSRSPDVENFSTIDTSRVRFDWPSRSFDGPYWVDPRWERELAYHVARVGPLAAGDGVGRRQLSERLAELSFVELAAEPEVLWPDGVRVPVRLRRPVACVPVGDYYQPVTSDGVLLSGTWDSPPPCGEGWLPVVGAPDHAAMGFDGTIDEDVLLHALSVAASMWEHLGDEDWVDLGRVVIDATGKIPDGGVRLFLDRGRVALFGRSPLDDHPGELAVTAKWSALSRALRLERELPPVDWDLVDLRWDRPELRLRPEPEPAADPLAQAESEPQRPRRLLR